MRQRHDMAAFSEFVEARSHALLRTAYLMVGDHQLAQDLLQEALVKTLIAWPRLREPEKVDALRAEDGRDNRDHLAEASLLPRTTHRVPARCLGYG